MRFNQGQVERLREEVEVLRGRRTGAVEDSEVLLAGAKQDWEETRRRCEREHKELGAQFNEAFGALIAFKEHVEGQLGALLGQVQRAAADVGSLAMPGSAAQLGA